MSQVAATMERLRGYPVKHERVRVGEREYELCMPADCDALLDDPRAISRFEQDEYMPYWATLWPAAFVLADAVAAWPRVAAPHSRAGFGSGDIGSGAEGGQADANGRRHDTDQGTYASADCADFADSAGVPRCASDEIVVNGGRAGDGRAFRAPTVLELGCGLGLVGLVAAERGYRVIVSDYDEDALAFAAENARINGVPEPEARFIDWRLTYDDLSPDRIVAADVLYEARHLEPVARFVRRHLRADGLALISDAQRSTADAFERVARECGLSVTCTPAERAGAAPGSPIRARIFQLRHRESRLG